MYINMTCKKWQEGGKELLSSFSKYYDDKLPFLKYNYHRQTGNGETMEYISAKIIVTKTKNLWKSIGMSKSKKSVEDIYREM